MSTRRVEFRLGMPNRGSWNGAWSGEGRNYSIVRRLTTSRIAELGITEDKPGRWYYGWNDGWGASITARIVPTGERLRKSDGFCGYDWMVRNILQWGTPECRCEWRPDPNSGSPGYKGEWERCIWCDTARWVAEAHNG